MSLIDPKLFHFSLLTEDASQYLFKELYKHVQTTILLAYFTAITLMLYELGRPALILIWLIPMCLLQGSRYMVATKAINNTSPKLRNVFLFIDYLTAAWWVAYLFIFDWQTSSHFDFAFRVFMVFIIITFYLNVMRYHLPNLLISSTIVCVGMLAYLTMFTQLPSAFKWAFGPLIAFGFFALVLFGRMSNLLAHETYNLIKENKALIHKMDGMLIDDELTHQYNRRYFNAELSKQLMLFNRTPQPFCLAMLDIDLFKNINDTHGHDVGDAILIQLGQFVRSQIRNTDIFARYGGEEFVIIFPLSKLNIAIKILDKLRKSCEGKQFKVNELSIQLTISIGVTQVENSDNETTIIKRADTALYKAKENGRNRIGVTSK